jgi:hypothetical protein
MVDRKWRIAWALTLIVFACAVTRDDEPEDDRAHLTVNHALHLSNGLECADCHDSDGRGEPSPPPAEFCQECHDGIDNDSDNVREYFAAASQNGQFVWPRWKERTNDIVFSHASHVGAYGAKCDHCHGQTPEVPFVRPDALTSKATCINCHQERGEDMIQCAVCHTETRDDRAPESHGRGFKKHHGKNAPRGWRGATDVSWRDAEGGKCALCHSVPDSCDSCHENERPDGHREASFRVAHGTGYFDAGLLPFEDTNCAMCHEENSCVRCHQTTKPRNHTLAWQRRFHGIQASVDRQGCLVCHKQSYCVGCHQTAKPISHRGTFARGTQSHCVACHEPLTASGCFTCHKNTRSHLTAPRLPGGAPHAGATDCRTCHRALRHFDDGLSCRRCHR